MKSQISISPRLVGWSSDVRQAVRVASRKRAVEGALQRRCLDCIVGDLLIS